MPRGVHTSKRKSGFQQRKAKQAKTGVVQSISGSIFKYVTKTDDSQSSSKETDFQVDPRNDSDDVNSISVSNSDNTELMITHENDVLEKKTENDNIIEDSNCMDGLLQNLRDVSYWSIPILDNVRIEIIKKGSAHFQNREGPFATVSRDGPKTKGNIRHLSKDWFYRVMPNGEKILRSWMVYSPITNNLYCFCCRLFAITNSTDTKATFVTGFQKWWKLNPKVPDHETSSEHVENFEKWKTLEMSLKLHKTIDDSALQVMDTEKQKWKNILSRLFDITLFLAKQNLAFRGHDEE